MYPRPKALVIAIVLMLWPLHYPGLGGTESWEAQTSAAEFTPENTVILANQQDARFSRDYSTLLKHLRLEWVILESATVPEAVINKDLILLGGLDAPHSGDLLREALTPGEIETVRAAGGSIVLEKESPWAAGRRLYICAGADLIQTRDAAEEAVTTLIARSPPPSAWIRTRFDTTLDGQARSTVDRLRYTWDDEELPLADLRLDVDAKPRRRITAQQAAEDVERLFYLFSHGYSGYAFFDQEGDFARAEARILDQLSTEPSWSSHDLSRLLYEQLDFITDCHMNIGDYQFAGHADFWYDAEMELTLGTDGYQFTDDGTEYSIVSVNGQAPEAFLFPSLNAQGNAVYRLGTLSETEPAPLLLAAKGNAQERQFEIALKRSDYTYYADDYFREDAVGGIPVIRVRNFGDVLADELTQFVKTGSAHRGAPVVIVDIRGNGGGNEAWPIGWIQGLTSQRAESVFIFSELNSKTTMAGRANVFAQLHDLYPDTDSFRREAERYTTVAEAFESGGRQPTWSGPNYPLMPLIPNETTVIMVTNGRVASAGEGLVMRASRAENVVLVGENTQGCLTFGNPGIFQLPHSRLTIRLPTNFGLYLDMAFREEVGIQPDLWVPAADAVNYAVAAVRSGTITTRQPLSPDTLQQPFVPEEPWARVRREGMIQNVAVALIAMACTVWAYFLRKKPRIVRAIGAVWIATASLWLLIDKEKPIGFGFLVGGAVCLVWGGVNLRRARQAPATD